MCKPYRTIIVLTTGEVAGKDFKTKQDADSWFDGCVHPVLYKAVLFNIGGSNVVLRQHVGFPHYKEHPVSA